jgi:hypothetical protein
LAIDSAAALHVATTIAIATVSTDRTFDCRSGTNIRIANHIAATTVEVLSALANPIKIRAAEITCANEISTIAIQFINRSD